MNNFFSFKEVLNRAMQINGALSNNEAEFLYNAAKYGEGKGEIVEIGSFEGKSTVFLASGSKQSKREKATAIDPHRGGIIVNKKYSLPTYDKFIKNIQKNNVSDWITSVKKYSKDAAKKWHKSIRLLFIDGNHHYSSVKLDIQKWVPYLSDNGIIIFHDALNPEIGPIKAINELILSKKKYKQFGVTGSILYAINSKPKNINEIINFCIFYELGKILYLILKLSYIVKISKIKIFLQQYIVKRYFTKLMAFFSYKSYLN